MRVGDDADRRPAPLLVDHPVRLGAEADAAAGALELDLGQAGPDGGGRGAAGRGHGVAQGERAVEALEGDEGGFAAVALVEAPGERPAGFRQAAWIQITEEGDVDALRAGDLPPVGEGAGARGVAERDTAGEEAALVERSDDRPGGLRITDQQEDHEAATAGSHRL